MPFLGDLNIFSYFVNDQLSDTSLLHCRYGRRIPYAAFMIFGGMAGMLVLAVPSDEGKERFTYFRHSY